MIIGHTLRAKDSGTTTYHSPWFRKAGNKGVFTCDVVRTADLSTLTIKVETKESEDDDDHAEIVNSNSNPITLSQNTQTVFKVGSELGATGAGSDGFKELVRLRYELLSDTNKVGWVHLRMLNPVWLSD